MLQYEKFDVSEGIHTDKKNALKECYVIIGYLKMLDLNSNDMFLTNVMIFR